MGLVRLPLTERSRNKWKGETGVYTRAGKVCVCLRGKV